MKYGGVDYSLQSPAITTFDTDTLRYEHYCLNDDKHLVSYDNIYVSLHLPYSSQEERLNNISSWAMIHLANSEHVFIEGYAFASSANRAYDIGENGGLLKHKLWCAGIPFTMLPPKMVKKYATGNGNADKQRMEAQWMQEVGIDIRKVIGQKWKKKLPMNPSSDLIDSYYILRNGLYLHEILK